MLHKLRNRFEQEQGFTLIELLVVVLIIGILAAIALPSFLGQKAKGQDASAKSDARNMVSQVESCFATAGDYTGCDSSAELGNTGLDYGSGPAQVQVTNPATANGYEVVATSKSGNTFTITKSATTGSLSRSCTSTGSSSGGCSGSTW